MLYLSSHHCTLQSVLGFCLSLVLLVSLFVFQTEGFVRRPEKEQGICFNIT